MRNGWLSKIARKLLKYVYPLLKWYYKLRRPLTVGVVAMIFNKSGELLLVRHSYRPGWCLPAGGVKKGESVQKALCREMHEELGLKLQKFELKDIYYHRCCGKHDHAVVFEVKDMEEYPKPDNLEIEEVRFFRMPTGSEDLKALLPEDTNRESLYLISSYYGGGE